MPLALLPLLQSIWSNKRLILEIGACLALAICLWWFGIRNPRVIKNQAAEISRLAADRDAAYGAVNLLTSIGARHAEIERESENNIQRIINSRKPGTRGMFISGGLLPSVFDNNSTAQ